MFFLGGKSHRHGEAKHIAFFFFFLCAFSVRRKGTVGKSPWEVVLTRAVYAEKLSSYSRVPSSIYKQETRRLIRL